MHPYFSIGSCEVCNNFRSDRFICFDVYLIQFTNKQTQRQTIKAFRLWIFLFNSDNYRKQWNYCYLKFFIENLQSILLLVIVKNLLKDRRKTTKLLVFNRNPSTLCMFSMYWYKKNYQKLSNELLVFFNTVQ